MTEARQIEPWLRLVRADNPSPMTGAGTNTWILGQDRLVVIDPGPQDAAHLAAIAGVIAGRPVEAILVTHAHLDHSALVPDLVRLTGAPVLGFGVAKAGRSPLMQALAATGQGGGEGRDDAFVPDACLYGGQILPLAGMQIGVIHTPGHMSGHLCFAVGDALFSGDHVMGWSSSLVSPPDGDMGAYIASLRRLMGYGAVDGTAARDEVCGDRPADREAEAACDSFGAGDLSPSQAELSRSVVLQTVVPPSSSLRSIGAASTMPDFSPPGRAEPASVVPGQGWRVFYPGHGEAVTNPGARLSELLAHRLSREVAILEALALSPSTPDQLVARIYIGVPDGLRPAARRSVFAHLIDLHERNKVIADPALSDTARYTLI